MTDPSPKVDVVQLGARMHYAVPSYFASQGLLNTFYTDIWTGYYPSFLRKMLPSRLSNRYHPDLKKAQVISKNLLGIRYSRWLGKAGSRGEETAAFLKMGRKFATWASAKIEESSSHLYCFNTVAREIFEEERHRHKVKILEQTLVPRTIEQELLVSEYDRLKLDFPHDSNSAEYERREAAEWKLADVIVAGSEFVKNSLCSLGVSDQKIVVIPYGYNATLHVAAKTKTEQTVKLLFIGNGGVRKGLFDLVQAIIKLGDNYKLSVVGKLSEIEIKWLSGVSGINHMGAVPASRIPEIMSSHDIFILPSLCEGSATVIYEAMSYGLPIVCTANSGSVVQDGVEGKIVPINSPERIADAIREISDLDNYSAFSARSLQSSGEYTVEKYGQRLLSLVRQFS